MVDRYPVKSEVFVAMANKEIIGVYVLWITEGKPILSLPAIRTADKNAEQRAYRGSL